MPLRLFKRRGKRKQSSSKAVEDQQKPTMTSTSGGGDGASLPLQNLDLDDLFFSLEGTRPDGARRVAVSFSRLFPPFSPLFFFFFSSARPAKQVLFVSTAPSTRSKLIWCFFFSSLSLSLSFLLFSLLFSPLSSPCSLVFVMPERDENSGGPGARATYRRRDQQQLGGPFRPPTLFSSTSEKKKSKRLFCFSSSFSCPSFSFSLSTLEARESFGEFWTYLPSLTPSFE